MSTDVLFADYGSYRPTSTTLCGKRKCCMTPSMSSSSRPCVATRHPAKASASAWSLRSNPSLRDCLERPICPLPQHRARPVHQPSRQSRRASALLWVQRAAEGHPILLCSYLSETVERTEKRCDALSRLRTRRGERQREQVASIPVPECARRSKCCMMFGASCLSASLC